MRDASREENDRVACGDALEDKGKDFASPSCHGTSIDLDDASAENVVTGDGIRSHGSSVEDVWTKLDALTPHRGRTADSNWRCRCEESHLHEEPTLDLLGLSCDRYCDGCRHHRYHCRDCFHRHCCCQPRDSSINAKGLMRHFVTRY